MASKVNNYRELELIINRILMSFSESIIVDSHELSVTASIGIVLSAKMQILPWSKLNLWARIKAAFMIMLKKNNNKDF